MKNKLELKNIIGNILWKFLERGTSLVVTFGVTIVLARLLDPTFFGFAALVAVFVAISNIFVTSGLGNALIQKKNTDALDFSSIFWLNLSVSLAIYLFLFFVAPYFALFFNHSELCMMLRVLSLRLLISAFNSIQCAYISKNMLFKFYFYSTLYGKIASGGIGIGMALGGCGVWALIGQSLSQILFETCILWFNVKWRPQMVFSWSRTQKLYSFAWKLMLTNFVEVISDQLRALLIGKKYTSEDLAYYDKGLLFPNTIITNIASSVSSVMFPVLANVQDERGRSLALCRRWIRLFAYCALPLLTVLAITAPTLIVVLLTEKWLPSVLFLQLACGFYAAWVIEIPIRETLKSLGHAGVCLRMQVIKTCFALVALLAVMNYGVEAIAASAVGCGVFNTIISVYYGNKTFHYTTKMLRKDIGPTICLNLVMACGVFVIYLLGLSPLLCFVVQVISGIILYFLFSILFENDIFYYCLQNVRMLIKK